MVIKIDENVAETVFNSPIIVNGREIRTNGHAMVVLPLTEKETKSVNGISSMVKGCIDKKEGKEPDFCLDVSLLLGIIEDLGTDKLAFWLGNDEHSPILMRPIEKEINGYGLVMPLRTYRKYSEKEE